MISMSDYRVFERLELFVNDHANNRGVLRNHLIYKDLIFTMLAK